MVEKPGTFTHKVEKSHIPTCNIMGVDIAAIDMDWLLDFTFRNIKALSGDYMCVSNVHTTVMSWEDKDYREIQNGGILAIPDGGPLSSVGRKRGHQNMDRTTGTDYMEEILKVSPQNGYRHYFYGSTQETLGKLEARIATEHPGIRIAGMYSPPFRKLTEEENTDVIRKINDSCADFVWISLGAPKQEIWMAEHQGKIKGFMVGVGAGFDYFAGNIDRAPQWMQEHGLEWLYRLWQDPKRLWKRYMRTNTRFVWHAVLHRK